MLQQRCLDTALVAAEVPRLSCCWQQRCLDTVDTALVSQYTALVAAEALLGWACFGQLDLHWWVFLAYCGLGLIYWVGLALVSSTCIGVFFLLLVGWACFDVMGVLGLLQMCWVCFGVLLLVFLF